MSLMDQKIRPSILRFYKRYLIVANGNKAKDFLIKSGSKRVKIPRE